MGMKRPLEEEDFPESSFRQPKQRDYDGKLTLHAEEYHITTMKVESPGEMKNSFYQLHFEQLEEGEADNASLADKELEESAPLSLITSSSSEEDAVVGETPDWSCYPGYIDLSIPRQPPKRFDDPYISLLNSPPQKVVSLGPDHQAEVPQWDPNAAQMGSSHYIADAREERLMGTCIIAMPNINDSTMEGVRVGRGRTDCSCLDMGSMRCVQQHVNEAREKLRETLRDDNFVELGFCNMGDRVAYKWTPHDEQVFHDIIYSNPASQCRRFWKHLSAAFPTRTKSELVSYYFNVFMLRRRAVQNRSYLLEIDSDDDEELRGVHGGSSDHSRSYASDQETDIEDQQHHKGEFYLAEGEDEDSTVKSFGDQDLDTSWMDDFWSEPQNGCGDETSDLKHVVSEGKVEKLDSDEMKERAEMMAGEDDETLHDDPRFYT